MHAVLLEWLPGFWLPASLRQSCLEISTTPVPSFPLMESGEVAGTVNLDSFTLDFMERDPNEGAWDEEGERILDNEDVLAQMLDAIPTRASPATSCYIKLLSFAFRTL